SRVGAGAAEPTSQPLPARADLARANDLLRLYGKAVTGANISVLPVTALAEKGIGWVNESGPSTEGTAVYLPEYIEHYQDKAENFAIFKVYATHQTAHIEFGSFAFSFRAEGRVLPTRRIEYEQALRDQGAVTKTRWVTDMERFFDLFPDRQLASDLF